MMAPTIAVKVRGFFIVVISLSPLVLKFYKRLEACFKTIVVSVARESNPRPIRLDSLRQLDHDFANQKGVTI
jgi:hypothetical protein